MNLDETGLRGLLGELLEQWGTFGRPQPLQQPAARRGKKFTGSDTARLATVYGLVSHVYATSSAVLSLLTQRHENAAIPLVRLAFESALSAAWLVQSKDQHGITAFLHEYARNRAALKRDAQTAESLTFREGASQFADVDRTEYLGSMDSAQRFQSICLDLNPGGRDAYIYYRILSSYSHASVGVSDLYWDPSDEQGAMPLYRHEPSVGVDAEVLLFLTAASLIWAGRAYSYLTRDQLHRSQLRQCARTLGINSELVLSDHYHRRHAKQGQRSRFQDGN